MRFSYANSIENIEEAIDRIARSSRAPIDPRANTSIQKGTIYGQRPTGAALRRPPPVSSLGLET